MSENKYASVLAASKSESILAVIEGLPVSANGFFLTEAQMDGIDAALVGAETNATALQTAEAARTAQSEKLSAAELELTNANNTIAELEATVVALGKGDAGKASGADADADPINTGEKTGWDKYETSVDAEAAKYKAIRNS